MGLVNRNGEQTVALMTCSKYFQGGFDEFKASLAWHSLPGFFPSCRDHARMKFNVFRCAETQRIYESIEFSNQMKDLALKNRDAAENEIALSWVLDRTRTVNIEDVHSIP